MGELFSKIATAVAPGEYIVSAHAAQRTDERRMEPWQVVAGISEATLQAENENALPSPTIEVGTSPGGRDAHQSRLGLVGIESHGKACHRILSTQRMIPGTRVKQVHWVHAEQFVVRLEVDAVTPDEDPSEPCYEPQTIEFLRQVRERADMNDLAWLQSVGKVYSAVPARATA